jgi:E3 ubiquitin-protein ligase EDD1
MAHNLMLFYGGTSIRLQIGCIAGIASLLMFPEEDSVDSSQQDDEDSEADTEPLDTEELALADEQLERRG